MQILVFPQSPRVREKANHQDQDRACCLMFRGTSHQGHPPTRAVLEVHAQHRLYLEREREREGVHIFPREGERNQSQNNNPDLIFFFQGREWEWEWQWEWEPCAFFPSILFILSLFFQWNLLIAVPIFFKISVLVSSGYSQPHLERRPFPFHSFVSLPSSSAAKRQLFLWVKERE